LCKFIKEFFMLRTLAVLVLTLALPVMAHEGHGLDGPHSHATDLIGFAIALVFIAGFWWSGRK